MMPNDSGVPLWKQLLERAPARSEMERVGEPGRLSYGGAPTGGLVPQGNPMQPGGNTQLFALTPEQLDALIRATFRQNDTFILPFVVGTDPVQLRPAENRRYLFVQNQSGANNMALGINGPPGPLTGVPVNGLVIPTNFGFYEPLVVPQGEIWIVAAAANTPGVLIYAA